MIKECVICESEYDTDSSLKKKSGGLFVHCPDCSEETSVKVFGILSGSEENQGLNIISFDSEEERQEFSNFYQNRNPIKREGRKPLGINVPNFIKERARTNGL